MKENKVKKQRYEVIGTLNNNGVVAKDELNKEVILLGKGIGFKRKAGDGTSSLCPAAGGTFFRRSVF